jgi:hypothetical protein
MSTLCIEIVAGCRVKNDPSASIKPVGNIGTTVVDGYSFCDETVHQFLSKVIILTGVFYDYGVLVIKK